MNVSPDPRKTPGRNPRERPQDGYEPRSYTYDTTARARPGGKPSERANRRPNP